MIETLTAPGTIATMYILITVGLCAAFYGLGKARAEPPVVEVLEPYPEVLEDVENAAVMLNQTVAAKIELEAALEQTQEIAARDARLKRRYYRAYKNSQKLQETAN